MADGERERQERQRERVTRELNRLREADEPAEAEERAEPEDRELVDAVDEEQRRERDVQDDDPPY
jgi:hypothetical protein